MLFYDAISDWNLTPLAAFGSKGFPLKPLLGRYVDHGHAIRPNLQPIPPGMDDFVLTQAGGRGDQEGPVNISENISGGSFEYNEIHAGYSQGSNLLISIQMVLETILETISGHFRGHQQ